MEPNYPFDSNRKLMAELEKFQQSQLDEFYKAQMEELHKSGMPASSISSLAQAANANDPTSYNHILQQILYQSASRKGLLTLGGGSGSMPDEDSYYPEGTVTEWLTPNSSESFLWHINWSRCMDLLNSKLGSARLRKLKKLWYYSGNDYRDLKRLERSLENNRDVVEAVENKGIVFDAWKFKYRQLKDLFGEIDELLDDIARHAPQLNQLFQFDNQHIQTQPTAFRPYLNVLANILKRIAELTRRLDIFTAETRSDVLKEIVLPQRQFGIPVPQGNSSSAWPYPSGKGEDRPMTYDDIPLFYAFHNQEPVHDVMNMSKGSRGKAGQISSDEIRNFNDFDTMKPVRQKSEPIRDEGIGKGKSTMQDPAPEDKIGNPTDFDIAESITRKPDRVRDEQVVKGLNRSMHDRIHDEEITEPYGFDMAEETHTGFSRLPENLKSCILYTSLFPKNYEFNKDMLVHLWIAAGFIRQERMELMEDVGGNYFDKLLSISFFQEIPLDYSHDRPKYKLHDDVHFLAQEYALGEYARIEDGNLDGISDETLHSSVLCEIVDPMIFRSFHKLNGLHSLLLLHDNRKSINQIPYDLFLNTRCLRVLDLSRTQIKELPSSVGNVKALCYLDLSKTSIRRLPESVSRLSNLQILKLRDCLDFVELPKDMEHLTNLRHLDLDIIRQLTFMPPRMGNLTNLQTLTAFIIGKESGYQIAELKHMKNLRGSLNIVKLENIITGGEAKEAALYNKQYLRKLELQWSLSCLGAEDVLEGLIPHRNIEELEIVCYAGLKFPRWFGDSSYSELSIIYLYNCKNCVILPPLGRLPYLKTLYIGEVKKLKEIDHQFCGGDRAEGFPSLERLEFDGMPSLESWSGVEKGEMPFLCRLTIVDCPKLVELPMLSNLKSLQHMEIGLCSELPLLAEAGLPTSLQTLIITGCPILKERCREEGNDWEKIAEIPNVWIDHHKISHN